MDIELYSGGAHVRKPYVAPTYAGPTWYVEP